MSTLEIFERHISPFDILFRNHFKSDSTFQPVGNFKQPHPLKISYTKPENEEFHKGMIHNGLSKKSFDLRYKIAPKFDLGKIDATLTNGLLEIFIPLAEEAKPKSIKIK
jgi:HSP20 family molecular chaperone IbpA